MRPGRVGDSLVQNVPALADGRLTLVSCTPQRLRAKGSDWLARYTVRVSEPGGATKDVVLVGNLRAPGQQFPTTSDASDASPLGDASPVAFGEPGWSWALPDLRLELRVQEHD